MREMMSIMGMQLKIYYITWFIRYFVIYLIVHAIGSSILISALSHVPYHIPFIIFILFDILLIIQSFFIQIFFTRSKIGIIFALVFFVVQYSMNYIIVNIKEPSLAIHQLISIVPHSAFILAFKEMAYAQSNSISLNFTMEANSYTLITAVISIVCNIVFWTILLIYLDQIVPNEWGAKKHPCFCFIDKNEEKENYIAEEKKENNFF